MLVGGSTALGVVVVRRDVLVHARLDGGLLALSLPVRVVGQALLALALLTVDSGGVDITVIRQPD